MDNGLWDALHRLLLKVDRLITDKPEKRPREETPPPAEETPQPTENEILATWKTFYDMGFREKCRIWNFSCGSVDDIDEYRQVQDASRLDEKIGYVNEDRSENGDCIWFFAFAHVTVKDCIVIEHRIKYGVRNYSKFGKTFSSLITVSGTPQQAFNWLQKNLGSRGYTGSSYAPIE